MSATTRARPLAREPRGTPKEILTPEGVPIRFTIASIGDRAGAFLIDFILILAATAVIVVLAIFASGFNPRTWLGAIAILTIFLIRNFYFVFFEIRWHGATPGKRYMGLRVIDATGGALRSEAVFVRNMTRELEVFLPAAALLEPELLWPDAPPALIVIAILWLLVFAFMPVFNRDRLRAGDMIGGTVVVLAPKAVLLQDLSHAATQDREQIPTYTFSRNQLDVYGIYELQVLEELLRQRFPDPRALNTVCEKIQKKIGWEGEKVDTRTFLREFYSAQRVHLERKLLFGERRERKREPHTDR